MLIGELAERTGLSLRTIRFYEEVGVLDPASRTKGGFRVFTEDDLQRLLVVRQMKPLGFSVEEMRELLAAVGRLADGTAGSARGDATRLVRDYQARVEERAADLHEQAGRADRFAADLHALIAYLRLQRD
jgi:MerR family transcriptional regulator, copper efflux regulator